MKAAPLVPVLRLLADEGLGAEVASPGELALARAAGVPPDRIVLDSPAKTPAELREALALGLAINVDNREELARLDALVGRVPGPAPRIGIRVNPQVGGGSIGALSTATETSKFGVALRDEGARQWLVRACAERPWLTRLHAHVGSQGCPPELLAAGVRATYELAEEIDRTVGGTVGEPGHLPAVAGGGSARSTSAAAYPSTSPPTRSRPPTATTRDCWRTPSPGCSTGAAAW